MIPHSLIRVAFQDELEKIAAKAGDVPTLGGPAERSATLSGGSDGAGGGTAPKQGVPPKPDASPAVELTNIGIASEGLYGKEAAAAWDALDPMTKEAILGKAMKFLKGSPKVVRAAGGETIGSIPMGGGGGLLSGVGKSLEESGKLIRKGPKQSVRGAKFTAEELASMPKQTGAAGRVAGRALEGAGHHIDHRSTLGLMANPLGVPLGGAIEGATKQLGVEARRSGSKSLGKGLYRHAGKAGLAGEIAGVAGAGTAMGAPVSAAGAIGGKLLAGAAPAAEAALHHGGDLLHHAGHDIVGMGAQKAHKAVGAAGGRLARAAGKIIPGLARSAT